MKIKSLFIALCLFCCPNVRAVEVAAATVTHVNGVYDVTFEVSLNADPQRVREIVTDYDHLHELSETIIHSKVLVRDGGRTRLDMLLRPCVWRVFCRHIRKVTDVTVAQDGSIHHRTVASLSDFSFAEEQLIIHAGIGHRGTQAHYRAELVPKFFVPPLIGPWLVRRQVIRDLTETAAAIERVAAGRAN